MIKFKDFVPEMLAEPGLFREGSYESFELAVETANDWIKEYDIRVVNVETVVLPNIWSRYEEGSPADLRTEWHVGRWQELRRRRGRYGKDVREVREAPWRATAAG